MKITELSILLNIPFTIRFCDDEEWFSCFQNAGFKDNIVQQDSYCLWGIGETFELSIQNLCDQMKGKYIIPHNQNLYFRIPKNLTI